MSGTAPTATEIVHAEVSHAAPFLNAGTLKPNSWLPSELILIGFYMLETGPGGEGAGVEYVNGMMTEARNRYAAGFYANPFAEPVEVRHAS